MRQTISGLELAFDTWLAIEETVLHDSHATSFPVLAHTLSAPMTAGRPRMAVLTERGPRTSRPQNNDGLGTLGGSEGKPEHCSHRLYSLVTSQLQSVLRLPRPSVLALMYVGPVDLAQAKDRRLESLQRIRLSLSDTHHADPRTFRITEATLAVEEASRPGELFSIDQAAPPP